MPCSDFSPGSGIMLLLGFPLQTHQSRPTVPQGSRTIRPPMAGRMPSPLPRQKSKCQAEAVTWLKTCTGAAQWVLSLAHLKGIRQEFANRGDLKHVLALPYFRGRTVSCGHQEDHTLPCTAAVPRASSEGVSAAGGVPLPKGN